MSPQVNPTRSSKPDPIPTETLQESSLAKQRTSNGPIFSFFKSAGQFLFRLIPFSGYFVKCYEARSLRVSLKSNTPPDIRQTINKLNLSELKEINTVISKTTKLTHLSPNEYAQLIQALATTPSNALAAPFLDFLTKVEALEPGLHRNLEKKADGEAGYNTIFDNELMAIMEAQAGCYSNLSADHQTLFKNITEDIIARKTPINSQISEEAFASKLKSKGIITDSRIQPNLHSISEGGLRRIYKVDPNQPNEVVVFVSETDGTTRLAKTSFPNDVTTEEQRANYVRGLVSTDALQPKHVKHYVDVDEAQQKATQSLLQTPQGAPATSKKEAITQLQKEEGIYLHGKTLSTLPIQSSNADIEKIFTTDTKLLKGLTNKIKGIKKNKSLTIDATFYSGSDLTAQIGTLQVALTNCEPFNPGAFKLVFTSTLDSASYQTHIALDTNKHIEDNTLSSEGLEMLTKEHMFEKHLLFSVRSIALQTIEMESKA